MSIQTRVLSRTTHIINVDPLSSNDFSNLANSPSPPLNYNTPATVLVNMSTRSVHVKKNEIWTGKYTIQTKTRKEPRRAYSLVWRYQDTNLIIWSCSYIFTTRRGVWDMNAFSFLVFIVCHNEETGNMTQRFFVYEYLCLCVCVCAHACRRHVATTPGEPSWWPSTPSLLAKPRVGTWVPQDNYRSIWPVLWS